MQFRTKAAALAAAAGLALAAAAGAAPALASPTCSSNCTFGTLAVGNTVGTTGFPTSVALSGQAGTTATATASGYSVNSNTNWTLTWEDDSTDVVNGNNVPPDWYIPNSGPPVTGFGIPSSTTLTHSGTTYSLPAGTVGNEVTSVQIDSGGATAGGQNFMDVYSVAIPPTAAPGSYQAAFSYTLAG